MTQTKSTSWPLVPLRKQIGALDTQTGLRAVIDFFQKLDLFQIQRNWVTANDPEVALFRYEDLASDATAFIRKLFSLVEFELPAAELDALCERHRFESYSGGRRRGEESAHHYRKGVPDEWRSHFDTATLEYFHSIAGDLVQVLGYSD